MGIEMTPNAEKLMIITPLTRLLSVKDITASTKAVISIPSMIIPAIVATIPTGGLYHNEPTKIE